MVIASPTFITVELARDGKKKEALWFILVIFMNSRAAQIIARAARLL